MEPATKIESNEGQLELFEMAEEEEFFDFNQDLENDGEVYRSPGWLRYQKRLK